jgi:hypothetical protein
MITLLGYVASEIVAYQAIGGIYFVCRYARDQPLVVFRMAAPCGWDPAARDLHCFGRASKALHFVLLPGTKYQPTFRRLVDFRKQNIR